MSLNFVAELQTLAAERQSKLEVADAEFNAARDAKVAAFKAAFGLRPETNIAPTVNKDKIQQMTDLARDVVDPARALASLALSFVGGEEALAEDALTEARRLLTGQ